MTCAPAPPPPSGSDAQIETVACEYDAPAEPAPFPTAQILSGFAIGGSIAVGVTAIILILGG